MASPAIPVSAAILDQVFPGLAGIQDRVSLATLVSVEVGSAAILVLVERVAILEVVYQETPVSVDILGLEPRASAGIQECPAIVDLGYQDTVDLVYLVIPALASVGIREVEFRAIPDQAPADILEDQATADIPDGLVIPPFLDTADIQAPPLPRIPSMPVAMAIAPRLAVHTQVN